ncbi:MAG: hypothetical protein Q8N15_05895 [Bacillota bacterium]|nr:hypothetical protein [Bacillota bacterium]
MNRKLLFVNAIFVSVYLVAGTLYYLLAGAESLVDHPVFAALYVIFIGVHVALVFLAVLFEWWAYAAKKVTPLFLANVFFVIAGIELALLLLAPAVMLIALILNLIAARPPRIKTV